VIGKFVDGTPDSQSRARQALDRALALNPRLSVAHKFYANLEGDMGQARQALVRLLGEANRHGNDPELFSASSTRVATVDSTTNPSPRTPRDAGSTRTSPRVSHKRS